MGRQGELAGRLRVGRGCERTPVQRTQRRQAAGLAGRARERGLAAAACPRRGCWPGPRRRALRAAQLLCRLPAGLGVAACTAHCPHSTTLAEAAGGALGTRPPEPDAGRGSRGGAGCSWQRAPRGWPGQTSAWPWWCCCRSAGAGPAAPAQTACCAQRVWRARGGRGRGWRRGRMDEGGGAPECTGQLPAPRRGQRRASAGKHEAERDQPRQERSQPGATLPSSPQLHALQVHHARLHRREGLPEHRQRELLCGRRKGLPVEQAAGGGGGGWGWCIGPRALAARASRRVAGSCLLPLPADMLGRQTQVPTSRRAAQLPTTSCSAPSPTLSFKKAAVRPHTPPPTHPHHPPHTHLPARNHTASSSSYSFSMPASRASISATTGDPASSSAACPSSHSSGDLAPCAGGQGAARGRGGLEARQRPRRRLPSAAAGLPSCRRKRRTHRH